MAPTETGTEQDRPAERPALRVVRGDASPEDVAAILALVAAASGGGPEPDPQPPSRWASRQDLVRRPLSPGPGAWRASARGW